METIDKKHIRNNTSSRSTFATLVPIHDAPELASKPMTVLVEQISHGQYKIRHDEPLITRRALLTFPDSSQPLELRLGATVFHRRGEYETIAWEPFWQRFVRSHEHKGNDRVDSSSGPSIVRRWLAGRNLVVKAERKHELNGKHGSRYRYGRFERTIPMPDGTETENIEARYHSGVLELQIPKSKESQNMKQIAVKS